MKLFKFELTPPVRALSAAFLAFTALEALGAALPEGYTKLEYIDNYNDGKNQGAYLNLDGIHPEVGQIVEMTFQLASASGDQKFFGAYSGSGSGVSLGTFSDCWRIGGWQNQNSISASTDVCNLRVYVGDITVDGTRYQSGAYFINDMEHPVPGCTTSTYGGDYALFGINYSTSKPLQRDKMRLYSFKITDSSSGEMVVNLIPAKDANGVVGVYDTVAERFLGSSAAGKVFTAGPAAGFPLIVAATPAEFGVPAPAYGKSPLSSPEVTIALEGGVALEGVSGTSYLDESGRTSASFSSATYAPEGGASETLDLTSFDRTLPEDGATVTWNFTGIHHRIVATAPEGALVRFEGGTDATSVTNWVLEGESVTLVATPREGFRLLVWTGDADGFSDLGATPLTFKVDRPRDLVYLQTEDVEGDYYAVDFTVNGYTGESTLTNFPVLVRLSHGVPAGFLYDMARADARDIRFTSSDDSVVYPHEIDTWNTDGESLIWVRIPELEKGASFRMHFGYSDADWEPDMAETWKGANEGYFAGVWHFREARGDLFDSAKHDKHFSMDGRARSSEGSVASNHRVAWSNMVSVVGAIGTGRKSGGCYWDVPSYDRFGIGSSFTVSAWIQSQNTNGRHISRQTSWADNGGWAIDFGDSKTKVAVYYGSASITPIVTGIDTGWHQYLVSYTPTDMSLYVDGALIQRKAVETGLSIVNDLALAIGHGSGGSDVVNGSAQYDEMRILSSPVNGDWAKACYDTASNPSFLGMGGVIGSSWEIPAAPEPVPPVAPWAAGAAVTIADEEIVVESTPPALSSLTVDAGGTLTLYGWDTLVSAETITVKAGGTIRTEGFILDGAMSNRVHLAGTTLTVEQGGRITADAAGYEGQAGPAWATATWGCHGDRTGTSYYGGAYGGRQGYFGNASRSQQSMKDMEPKPYGSAEWPFDPGSGGGCCARSGGGAIYLEFTGAVTVDGAITANASDTYKSSGNWYGVNASYGSGGGIVIECQTISGSGKVSADSVIYNSDKATTNYSGTNVGGASGGSGGRIAVHYDTSAQGACNISFSARGGLSYTGNATVDPSRPGEPGTLWFPDDRLFSAIGTSGVTWAGVLTVPGKTEYAFPSGLTLADGSQLGFSPDVRTVTVTGDLTACGTCGLLNGLVMPANGTLSVSGNATFTGAGLKMDGGLFSVGGDLTQAQATGGKRRNGSVLTVQANGTGLVETNATAVVKVAGTWTVGDGCTCFAKCAVARDNWGFSYPFFSVGNLNLAAGGAINANEAGYKGTGSTGTANGTGPGRGAWAVAHGGRGGYKTTVTEADLSKLGTIYGSEQRPLEPGSASTSTSWIYDGFIGGGIVRIDVENKAFVNGTISANGNAVGSNPMGSSGGSVWLSAFRLGGTGSVTALGGVGGNGVAGGGGRIALWSYKWMDETLKANCSAAGGTHGGTYVVEPEAGTVYFGQLKPGGTMIFLR